MRRITLLAVILLALSGGYEYYTKGATSIFIILLALAIVNFNSLIRSK